jgi:uncharacterized lipoprotein YddW (UPF0748 family)
MNKIRGVWLTTAASTVFESKASIIDAMKLLVDAGFNTVFPVVWNNGYTLYPSKVLNQNFETNIKPGLDRDILREVIDAAGSDLQVIPWFEYGFMASYKNDGGHILKKKPQWSGQARGSNRLIKGDFVWMNSLNPEVQDFMVALFSEVVTNYPEIAGVQGDDHLAMPSEGGYDDITKKLYRLEFGANQSPPSDPQNPAWLKWRAGLLTDFLARLSKEVKAINPNLIFSMSPSIHPFGFKEYLQDFPAWIKRDIVDAIHPQLYPPDFSVYQQRYEKMLKDLVDQTGQEKASIVSPGVLIRTGTKQINKDVFWQCIRRNRLSGYRGESLFFFEGLKENNNELLKLLKEKNYAGFVYFQEGNVGEDIQEIQVQLKAKGFYNAMPNGRFDSVTKKAVMDFQTKYNQTHSPKLIVDGIIGPLTYAELLA